MAIQSSLVAFVVGALVGGLAIHVAARVVLGRSEYGHAVWTALIGAAVWAVVSYLFAGFPTAGPVLALVAWIGVIKWRYGTGWVAAAGVGLVAWLTSLVVLWLLARFGVRDLGAVGVPGV